MKANGKVECVINVDGVAVGTDADGAWIFTDIHGPAQAVDFPVIVVHNLGNVHIIGAGVDGVNAFAVGRQGGLPRVGHHAHVVVRIEGDGGAPFRVIGRHQIADR